jgi:hypothetical protein
LAIGYKSIFILFGVFAHAVVGLVMCFKGAPQAEIYLASGLPEDESVEYSLSIL